MRIELTEQQARAKAEFRAFVDQEIAPYADQFDQEERIPDTVIKKLAREGYLGRVVPAEQGGSGTDMVTFGLLNEELGRGCSSIRSLLTVHSMAAFAIMKWGSKDHKSRWLPQLVRGDLIGAFALSEPNVGSDAKSVETSARLVGDSYVLNGRKRWMTFGQIADIFLLFGQIDGKVTAFLVEKDSPGFSVEPIRGILGTRGSMLAELRLENCEIPKENRIGGIGFGLAAVGTSTLDIGRYSVAWGSVGIAQACLEACVSYTGSRTQFGVPIKDHDLVRQMMTNMITNTKAARLLCLQAGYLKDSGDPRTVMETWIAKYFASTSAMKIATDAVQLHGANGCTSEYPVQRYFRDAKIMEIIEASTQLQQINIAQYAYED
jgi:glutaryl-CoA dehydrogenase (non-decarboxylating)